MLKSVYKNLLAIFFLLAPVFVSAQRTFQFTIVDQATGKPLGDKWGTVIKNNIDYLDGVHSNKSGVCTFTDRKYDSTATYQFEITNGWNNGIRPAYIDISGIKTSAAITVRLLPAKYKVKYTCGEVLYRNYYARQAFTMDSLPADIQLKVKNYLTARVGDEFYKKLVLNGGQWLDLKKFYALNTDIIDPKKYHPPTYSLCFMVWDTVSHSTLYNFSLELYETGKLKGIVELPDIRRHPEKAKIIDSAQANSVARKNNFLGDGEIGYDSRKNSIAWKYQKFGEPKRGKTPVDRLFIDAHTGVVTEKRTSYEIIME